MTFLENLITIRRLSDYFDYGNAKKTEKQKKILEAMIKKLQKGNLEKLLEDKNG